MDTLIEPQLSTPVQLVDACGDPCGLDFGQEGFAQLPEAALYLSLALGVTSATRCDLGAVVGREVHRSPMQLEPAALAGAECAHPVRARRRGHPAEALEGQRQALEGVVLVLRGREPPHALAAPAQDRPETAQRTVPPPPRSDAVEVTEIELRLLAGAGDNRHRHRRGRPETRTSDLAHCPHHRRIGTTEPLSAQLVVHRGRQQPRMAAQQRLDPGPPHRSHHRPLTGRRDPSRAGRPP